MKWLLSKKLNKEWMDKGVANTLLAYQLNVDFELVDTEYDFQPAWKDNPTVSRMQLVRAIDTYFNVIDQIIMTVRKV